jgi:uncharacterized protein (TIGR02099 family)
MNLQKIYKVISVWLWSIIVIVLVLLALYASMGRHYLPQLGAYQNQLVSEIEARAGIKLSVGAIEGFWSQLSPGITLVDVNIPSSADESLPGISIDELEATVDFFNSVLAFTPLFDSLVIKNPDIHLYQTSSGEWSLAGFSIDNSNSDASSAMPFKKLIRAASYIQIENADIYFHPNDQAGWAVGGLNIDLYRGVGVNLAKILIENIAGDVVLVIDAESKGNFGDSDFRVKAHGVMDEFDLIPLLTLVGVKNIGASGLNGDVWFDWVSSKGGSLQGSLAADNFRVSSSQHNNATKLSDLKTNYLIDIGLDLGVQAWVTGLSVEWKNSVYSLADFNLGRRANNDIYISLREANVERLLKLASRTAKFPEQLSDVLTTIAPTGSLQNITVTKAGGVPLIDGFSFSAKVKDLNSSAWNGAPGVEKLSGYLTGGALSGRFDIDAKNMSLSFPGIYENSIPTSRLLGSVAWNVDDAEVTVNSGPLTVVGDFGSGNAQLDLAIPLQKTDDTYPLMSLLIGVKDFDVKYRNQVIPAVVGASLIEWLDQSILAGNASEVGFIYYGSLLKNDINRQVVQVELDATGAELKYDPAWPIAKNIATKVIVSDGDTRGYVKSATIYNSVLDNINVEVIPKDGIIALDVSGDIDGPAADILKLFKETSLKDILGAGADTWQSSGNYSANINLAMPLVSGAAPIINITGELHDVDLEKSDANLQFTKLRGDIAYTTQNGLSSKNIAGNFWGRKFQADIKTLDQKTLVNIKGSIEMIEMQQWLQQPVLGFAVGTAQVEGQLQIAGEDNGGVQLAIRSTMKGVAIDLPEPFFKAREETMPFEANIGLATASIPVTLSLGDLAKMSLFTSSANEDFRAIVVVGGGQVAGLPEVGMELTGSVNNVLLDDWLSVIDRYEQFIKVAKEAESEAASPASNPVFIDDLKVGELNAFGQIIQNSVVGLHFVESRWVADMEHQRLRGKAWLPSDTQQLKLELDYIHLPLVDSSSGDIETADTQKIDSLSEAADPLGDLNPSQYLGMSVISRATYVNDIDLGSWAFTFNPSHNGAVISGIKADVSGMRVSGFDDEQGGDLFWTINDGVIKSEFSGILSAGDVGRVFEAQNMAPPIISKKARFITNVNWAGSPAAIAVERFNGDIQIDMRDGQFLQTDSTATGALKLLGVLNFNNLVRRLQLDFSDLYKNGLSYNSVDGIMLFDNGMLKIEEPLHVKGPSSDFKMTGSLDLNQETIAGELVVTLPITSNLPWIVALVGGVPAAAGTYLASLIFKEQLNKLSSAVYKISGTWSEPKIAFDRLFDLKKKKK